MRGIRCKSDTDLARRFVDRPDTTTPDPDGPAARAKAAVQAEQETTT